MKAHIGAAAMDYFKMDQLDSEPSPKVIIYLPSSSEDKRKLLHKLSCCIVNEYVNIKTIQPSTTTPKDRVREYASEAWSVGLFHEEFYDAMKEGDSQRVLRCWRFLLHIYKASNCTNYSIEALWLLLQYHFLLPTCQAQQLLNSRFINTCGIVGHNIESDLHMEHLNRLCKDAVQGLGANKMEKAISRVGKCIQTVIKTVEDILADQK